VLGFEHREKKSNEEEKEWADPQIYVPAPPSPIEVRVKIIQV